MEQPTMMQTNKHLKVHCKHDKELNFLIEMEKLWLWSGEPLS